METRLGLAADGAEDFGALMLDLFSSTLDFLEGDAPCIRTRIYLDMLYNITGDSR